MRFLAILIISAIFALPVRAEEGARTLTVVGRGEVSVVPDTAVLNLGVGTIELTARRAMAENSAVMARVIAALRENGVVGRDIQTSSVNLGPRWERVRNASNDEPKIIGYVASNTVTVRVRDIGRAGEVLDEATKSGANQVFSVSFILTDRTGPLDRARALAVADAMRKAVLYADAAGVKTGRVLSLREPGVDGSVPRESGMLRFESAVPVEAGELAISAQVQIVLEIE